MSTIDERVVSMKFDNAQFERGVKSTLDSLSALNKGLQMQGATKGLSDISSAAKGVSLGNIADSVDKIASKFNAMSVVAITALANIASRAVNAGITFAKSFTSDPIKQGLAEYETNLNAIQTVMANTGLEGRAGLNKVNQSLNELNTYSDKTIYNFSEMARNIGTFTAAGVDLKTATGAIKGIANLAAVSGASADQASTAMYQLSQALASGTVKLMDWNSVVNAGMGGKVFQNALKETARNHGVAIDSMIKKEGSFRESLKNGWLTSNILTETLSKFTGDLSAQQLKSMGYNEKQIAGIMKMGKTAQDAATKVKTMSQLISTLQEAAGSGWTNTWQILFGDFEEARTLFTNVSNVLGGFISSSAKARNAVLGDWKALGGRTALIDAISLAFQALMAVIKPIKDAFRMIFPPATGKMLMDMTIALHVFAENLLISGKTANELKRVFAGVFAIFDLGWQVVKEVGKTLAHLFGVATQGSGGFLAMAANVGTFLVKLHDAILYGDGFTNFFKKLGDVLAIPIKLLQAFGHIIATAFGALGNIDTSGLDKLKTRFEPLGALGNIIATVWSHIGGFMKSAWQAFQPISQAFSDFFAHLGETVAGGFGNIDYSSVLDTINTGLFAGLVLVMKKFLSNGVKVNVGGGFLGNITQAFKSLTGTLQAMQMQLKAKALMELAAAIGILTISVVALSMIDSGKLTSALTAITVMFTQLAASMAVFQRLSSGSGAVKLPLIAAGLILLAIGVDILASAVKKLSDLSWGDLTKGLLGVTVLIGGLTGAVKLMSGNSARMVSTGAGLILLATGIRILVNSVTTLSGLSWEAMAKGLTGVAGLLTALALFTKFSEADKGGIAQGVGIILLATGIQILSGALQSMGGMSWEAIGKGLAAMAGGLTLMAAALILIPPSSLLSAAAVLIVASSLGMIGDAIAKMGALSWGTIGAGLTALAGALGLIAGALALLPPSTLFSAAAIFIVASSLAMIGTALQSMGAMSWEAIGKGLVTLAGSLGIIAIAMFAMQGALPGAAALLVVSASLAILAPILMAFGAMSWESIGKGLLMLAGAFTVLGVAGLLLTPVIPTLLGLGIAITLLGIGMLAAGGGLMLFSVGLTALSVAGAAGAAAIVGIVGALVGTIPVVMKQIGLGIIAFAQVIATAGPAMTRAMVAVMTAILNAVATMTPRIVSTLLRMLLSMLSLLAAYVPALVSAGSRIIVGFLNGIAAHIGGIITAATNVAVAFINGISNNLGRIVQSGANLVIRFVNGVAGAIRSNSAAVGAAGGNLASAIIAGMGNGLMAGIGTMAQHAANLARSALNAAKAVLGIHSPSREFYKIGQYVNQGFADGLNSGNRTKVAAAFTTLKNELSDAMRTSTKDILTAEAKLRKLTSARHKDRAAIKATQAVLAQARIEHAREASAYGTLMQNYGNDRTLQALADKYNGLTTKIKSANDTLDAAKKTRDDYNKSVNDQYSNLPDIATGAKLTDYITEMQKKIIDTQEFSKAVQKLHDLGLNDTMYKELISKGPDSLPFVQQLLDGGKNGINEINSLGSSLSKAAAGLANTASTDLYQAAVNSAQGLVVGLQKQQAAIDKQMEHIADSMVNAIKKKLGIHSPSREFAKIGVFSAQGVVQGLSDSSVLVSKAAESVGHEAINVMKKTLTGLSDVVGSGMDTINPTITPVLDLTSVKKDAGQIGSMLSTGPISVGSSYSTAKNASAGYQSNQAALVDQTAANAAYSENLTFIQNNNSPKALSNAEIYRQTKNQLSVAKGALSRT